MPNEEMVLLPRDERSGVIAASFIKRRLQSAKARGDRQMLLTFLAVHVTYSDSVRTPTLKSVDLAANARPPANESLRLAEGRLTVELSQTEGSLHSPAAHL